MGLGAGAAVLGNSASPVSPRGPDCAERGGKGLWLLCSFQLEAVTGREPFRAALGGGCRPSGALTIDGRKGP